MSDTSTSNVKDFTNNFCYGGPIFINNSEFEKYDNTHGVDGIDSIPGNYHEDCIETFSDIYADGYEKYHNFYGNMGSYIFDKCMNWMDEADYCFAYIDSHDCYGSIVELIHCKNIQKKIYIFFKNKKLYRDMWFLIKYFGKCVPVISNPKDAWTDFITRIKDNR